MSWLPKFNSIMAHHFDMHLNVFLITFLDHYCGETNAYVYCSNIQNNTVRKCLNKIKYILKTKLGSVWSKMILVWRTS